MKLKRQVVLKVKEGGYIRSFISCLLGPIHSLVRALLFDFFRDQKENCTSIDFSIKWIEYSGCIGADFLMVSNCVTTNRNVYKTKMQGIGRHVAKEFKPDHLMHSINLKCVCCVEHKCVQGMSPKSTVTQILPFAGKRRRKACDQKDLRLDNDHQW